jgi:subtilisin family serine protease
LLGCAAAWAAAAPPASAAAVGEDVEALVAAAGRARVIVFLQAPAMERPARGAPPALPAAGEAGERAGAVALVQDRVLAGLGPDAFHLARRFARVPALAGEVTAEGLGRLRRDAAVLAVDLDEGGTGSLAESVPLVNAHDVAALGWTGAGATVAVVDSGVDTDHPDLADDLVAEACFCSGGFGCCPGGVPSRIGAGSAEDDHGHGTHVAGIVTSGGAVAPAGVAADAGIVAVKVLDSANTFCCSSDVVAALDWILDSRPDVDVVNMSLGTTALFSGRCDRATSYTRAFAAAIEALRARGTLVVVSSGNRAESRRMSAPACVESAVSVGAVYDADVGGVSFSVCSDSSTAADKVTCFSNTSEATDLAAPGAFVTATGLNGGTATFVGTSQAAPHAAGCAAALREAFPSVDDDVLEAALKATGVAVVDPKNGQVLPRIDCLAALEGLACADADADGLCDLEVTLPRDGDVICADPPPTLVWNPEEYDRFRAEIAWDPGFGGRMKIGSGDTLLKEPFWTVPAGKWEKACGKASGTLHLRVFAKSRATGATAYSPAVAIQVD